MAVIRHGDEGRPTVASGADAQFGLRRGRHGVKGIADEVDQHLLNGPRHYADSAGPRAVFPYHLHARHALVEVQQFQAGIGDVVNLQRFPVAAAGMGKAGHLPHDLVDAGNLRPQRPQRCLVHALGLALQQLQQHIHARQRVGNFVGDARRHLPQGGHLLLPDKRLLLPAHLAA